MKISSKLGIVGTLDLIRYQYIPASQGMAVKTFSPADFLMTVNESKTILFLFRSNPTGGKKRISINREMVTGIEYEVPNSDLKRIGRVLSIQYTSNLYTDDDEKYEHVFDTPALMYADRLSRFGVIGIRHARGPILNDRGITG